MYTPVKYMQYKNYAGGIAVVHAHNIDGMEIARFDVAGEEFCAAFNACIKINPTNPLAVAQVMPEIFETLKKLVKLQWKLRSGGVVFEQEWTLILSRAIDVLSIVNEVSWAEYQKTLNDKKGD